MNEKWSYGSEIVTRIPQLVGEVWEQGYVACGRCEPLKAFECVIATSSFDGSHMGGGYSGEVYLGKDKGGTYCLIRKK